MTMRGFSYYQKDPRLGEGSQEGQHRPYEAPSVLFWALLGASPRLLWGDGTCGEGFL